MLALHRYPKVADFSAAFPLVFKEEAPTACQVDEGKLAELRVSLPARKTHSSLKPIAPAGASQMPVGSMTDLAHVLQNLLPILAIQTPSRKRQTIANDSDDKPPPVKQAALALQDSIVEPALLVSASSGEAATPPPLARNPSAQSLSQTEGGESELDGGEGSLVGAQAAASGDKVQIMMDRVREAIEKKRNGTQQTGHQDGAGRGDASGKAKGKAKGKSKAAAKPVNHTQKPSTPAAGKAKGKATAKGTTIVTKAPTMPPLKNMPTIVWGPCSIYSSEGSRSWRVTCAENRRYDKSFSWKVNPAASWQSLVAYCTSKQ